MGRAESPAVRLEVEAENDAEIKRSSIAPDCKETSAALEY